jgi:tRNA 2-thiouridine synthesizing protein B
MDIFLLTKPPRSSRAELCFKLLQRSADACLYLAGDGVYWLLEGLDNLPVDRVIACQEDLAARGVREKSDSAIVPECFYDHLMVNMMRDEARVYAF